MSYKTWTILVCCFNCTKTIKATIESIVFENNDDIDVFLIDDGSKDNLYPIIKDYLKKYPKQLHYFRKENGNQGSCINYAIKRANSRFLSLLDSDDFFNKNNFNKVLYSLRRMRKNTDLIITNYEILFKTKNGIKVKKSTISKTSEKIKYIDFKKMNLFKLITIHSSIYSLNILKKIKPLPEHVSYADICLYYEVLLIVKKIAYLNKQIHLYKYCIRKESQTIYIKNSIKKFNDFIYILNCLLTIPIKKMEKKRKNIAKKIIGNHFYWIMCVVAQNYNLTEKEKIKIVKKCYFSIKQFENNNDCNNQIIPFIPKLLHLTHDCGMHFANFLYSLIPLSIIKATRWTKEDKKELKIIKKEMSKRKRIIKKHNKLLQNSSKITNI